MQYSTVNALLQCIIAIHHHHLLRMVTPLCQIHGNTITTPSVRKKSSDTTSGRLAEDIENKKAIFICMVDTPVTAVLCSM